VLRKHSNLGSGDVQSHSFLLEVGQRVEKPGLIIKFDVATGNEARKCIKGLRQEELLKLYETGELLYAIVVRIRVSGSAEEARKHF
jgi:hypothetical protein